MRSPRVCIIPLAAALVGCASTSDTPPIRHVVFFELHDGAHTEELMSDCDRLLRPIPSVRSFAAGPPIDTGRETVLSDYDVGLVIGFDTVEGYDEYVKHPQHIELVESWGPRIAALRVYDIHDTSGD